LRPSERRSEATLHGTYLFADHGVDTTGKTFAGVGYEVFDGNGNIEGGFSANFNGKDSTVGRRRAYLRRSRWDVVGAAVGTLIGLLIGFLVGFLVGPIDGSQVGE